MADLPRDAEVLLQRYLEDNLTAVEAEALLALLQSDPATGDRLLDELSLDAMLRESKAGGGNFVAIDGGAERVRQVRVQRFSFSTMAGVAALAACLALGLGWVWQSTQDAAAPLDEATTAAVAVLTRGINLEWEDPASAPTAGAPLAPGWLRLKAGVAQIEFYQGARVTLEGPAAFRVISSNEAYCTSGKLSAHVPPQAKGFRIETPKGTIVDLGTDFGLDLGAAGGEVHVFKGEVELHSPNTDMQSLKEGEALLMASVAQPHVADHAAFASLTNMEERTTESQRVEFERWLGRSAARNGDPSLLLRFDFQDAQQTRALSNRAEHSPQVPAGSIVGCDWGEGRWPGKRALDFRNVSDRVRLSVPGEHRSLTFSAWVRVDGLDRAFNSLFMVEGYQDGAVHWQLTRQGLLRLGVAGRDGKASRDYDTPPIITPERFGQWTHLATVYDGPNQEVRHFMNGRLVARVAVPNVFPLRLGVADLGNWNDGGRNDRVAIRHFSGAIEEFCLYGRALSEAELRELR